MSDQNGVVVILVTAPDGAQARQLGRRLVEEKLVACVNVMAGVHSIYHWEDALEEADESLMVLKARREDVEVVTKRVQELHPYDVPEVIALDIVAGNAAYTDWIRSETER